MPSNASQGLGPNGPQVAVAIVSWNTRDLLAACLDSLRPDFEAGRAELWVVDNASEDGSAELVEGTYPWVQLIASQENLGFGPAVNEVARRTTTPWIAPANSDIRVEPGALERLLSAGDHDPDAGAVAPRLIAPDGTTQHSVFPFPTVGFTLAYNVGIHHLSRRLADRWCIPGRWDDERAREVPWAVGAFMVVRRTAWDAAGGFDAEQWMYAEDVDLGWRLKQNGWHTRYEPAARLHHEEAAATSQLWGDDRTTRWHASTYAWMLRRRGPLVTRTVAVTNVVGAAARAALLTPVALLWPRWRPARRAALGALHAHRAGLARRSELDSHH